MWNIKTGVLAKRLVPQASQKAEVTAIALSIGDETLAVGHSDGVIRLWQLETGDERVVLHGHRGAVLALRMSQNGAQMVSGAKDTAAILWDVVAEVGVCRLRGHRDAVTDVCLLEPHHALATVSKDGTLCIWDLHTQHCVQHVATPSGELWSVDVNASCCTLLTGGASAEVLAWNLDVKTIAGSQPPQVERDANREAVATAANQRERQAGDDISDASEWRSVRAILHGRLDVRVSSNRVVRLRFGLNDRVVAVQFADRNLALYSVQSDAQLKRQLRRRAAKHRKTEGTQDSTDVAIETAEGVPVLSAADYYQLLAHVRSSHKLHSFVFLPHASASAATRTDASSTAKGDGMSFSGTMGNLQDLAAARLLVANRGNRFELHPVKQTRGTSDVGRSVAAPGHRTEPRGLAMSTDERFVISASDGEARLWSVRSRQCMKTFSCGYGLAVAFTLASKYAAIGTKVRGALPLRAFTLSATRARLR